MAENNKRSPTASQDYNNVIIGVSSANVCTRVLTLTWNSSRTMNQQKIENVVSLVCDQGCRRIRMLIPMLETGAAIEEARELDTAERQAVLAELKSIMAIYDLRK